MKPALPFKELPEGIVTFLFTKTEGAISLPEDLAIIPPTCWLYASASQEQRV